LRPYLGGSWTGIPLAVARAFRAGNTLLVLAALVLVPNAAAGEPLDSFNCYKVKDLKDPAFVPQSDVILTDLLGTSSVDAKVPALLCMPTSAEGAISDPSTYLCCYKTKSPKLAGPAHAQTADQFGGLQVRIKSSGILCQPCSASISIPCSSTTAPRDGDGCCPAGASSATDSDCAANCGDAVVQSAEQCDVGIASGPGSCPKSCDDPDACTRDVLIDAGTCEAQCAFTPITSPHGGDGCCPVGGNANTDTDCDPLCGNGVVETGEQCDDGDVEDGDGCSANCSSELGPPLP
jgi:cysteine-rich repeat protein